MEKEVVKELIQDELNTNNLVVALSKLLEDSKTQKEISANYADLKEILMTGEKATDVAAEIIMETIQKK
jgi:lipid-A-disaccharide synthase